ncbi:hypothetical protein FRX31_023638 [Thalictrum thalictroides]|uniref:Uncharacterized protein n=1 Tax=Thalictrum thalictroides TaxID=46969 RepID=A0A7J6VRC5_THATH|nr:hypothetical protein FRX31_023638 [Thalictrum thalictroides]
MVTDYLLQNDSVHESIGILREFFLNLVRLIRDILDSLLPESNPYPRRFPLSEPSLLPESALMFQVLY